MDVQTKENELEGGEDDDVEGLEIEVTGIIIIVAFFISIAVCIWLFMKMLPKRLFSSREDD